MRGGLSGFYVFLACIALGVAAIARSTPSPPPSGDHGDQGRAILGGDISFELDQPARDPERTYLQGLGTVSTTTLRSMARLPTGLIRRWSRSRRCEGYPLYGTVEKKAALPSDLIAKRDGLSALSSRSCSTG